MPTPKPRARLAFALAILAPTCAYAQTATPADQATDAGHGGASDASPGEIIVTGHPPVDYSLMAGTAKLEGDKLVARTRGQIGEMLASLPGVSASSFAPGVSRPVLRGLDGDRIRVLVDGIGSIDASSVSADHAVVFDPLTVDHIDVLHGPAVLLFGGQAIGGAVNALDKRIPRTVPETISMTAIGGYATAARERSAGGAIDVRLSDRVAAHLDANWRKSDDMRVGGFVNSAPLRAALLADAADHRQEGESDIAATLEADAALTGRVPNSATRNLTLGGGVAFIDAGGNIGVSAQRFESRYGVPMRPGAGDAHGGADGGGPAPVAIDLVQTRVDLRAALNLSGMLESLQLRGAFGEYRHLELEGDEAGTRFAGNGIEFRADLVQRDITGWRGRSGVQYLTRKLAIAGAEAFVPDNQVDRFGVFTLQSLKLDAIELEGAGRYERAEVTSNPVGYRGRFDLWSGAAGISVEPADGFKIGANYIRGARAPSPEELLSDGMHAATQSYERGNRGFSTESSNGFEAFARYRNSTAEFSLTAYHTRFGRFIASMPTGETRDGLPVFEYRQLPARFSGFEASARFQPLDWGNGELVLDSAADLTRARLPGVGAMPRIPPLRLRGGAEARFDTLRLHAEAEWNARQRRVAAFEYPVAPFTLVNIGADWHPMGDQGPVTLMLAADNLFDVVGRRASSFTRDFVPLPGRDVRVTMKLAF